MPSDSPHSDENKYCSDLVRRYDRDRYLCGLFAPDTKRHQLTALYAFNIEISGTRETVSEPLIGQMRLKWWFDALENICAGEPPAHQVAVPLSAAIGNVTSAREKLERLIEARLTDLDDKPLADLEALISYANDTAGTLAELALVILGITDERAMMAARSAGIAYALTGMVRAVPLNIVHRRLFLPEDICKKAGIQINTLVDEEMKSGVPAHLIEALTKVTDCAKTHLIEVEGLREYVPKDGKPAVLFNVLTRHYLKELDRYGNDPFKLALRPPGPGVGGMVRLLWASAIGRI